MNFSNNSIRWLRTSWRGALAGVLVFAAMPNLHAQDMQKILPGSGAFTKLEFSDYEARYNSSSSKTGEFTLQVRRSGDGKKLAMIDIIPMENTIIVAQRQIDLVSQRVEFSAGPYFAWGPEFIVSTSDASTYSWTRVPQGGGEPIRLAGDIDNNGYVSEMFSPLLASLMPMKVGAVFELPSSYARQGDYVSSEMDRYEVLSREEMRTPSGLSCTCWLVEKTPWAGSVERIWVDVKPPFVFKRHRDVNGPRSFVSELTAYRVLEK